MVEVTKYTKLILDNWQKEGKICPLEADKNEDILSRALPLEIEFAKIVPGVTHRYLVYTNPRGKNPVKIYQISSQILGKGTCGEAILLKAMHRDKEKVMKYVPSKGLSDLAKNGLPLVRMKVETKNPEELSFEGK